MAFHQAQMYCFRNRFQMFAMAPKGKRKDRSTCKFRNKYFEILFTYNIID